MTNSISGSHLKEGWNTTFECFIDAVPLPIAVWSKDNGTTFSVASKSSNPSLFQIDNANCVDTGNYTCAVDNHITKNSLDYRTFRLIVNCVPRLKMLQTNPELVRVATSEGLDISTYFIGYPLPNITWSFNDKPIENSGSVFVTKTKDFEILSRFFKDTMSENDFGIYTVVAENEFGKATASYNVQAQKNPSKPSEVTVRCLNHNSAMITWISDDTIEDFYILYRSRDKDYRSALKQQPANKKLITEEVVGLQDSTFYSFVIVANNSFGISFSNEVNCTTYEKPKEYRLTGAIAGSTIAGFVFALIIITVSLFVYFRMRKRKTNTTEKKLRCPDNQETESKYEELQAIPELDNYDILRSEVANGTSTNNASDVFGYEHMQRRGNASEYEDVKLNGKGSSKDKSVYANTVIN